MGGTVPGLCLGQEGGGRQACWPGRRSGLGESVWLGRLPWRNPEVAGSVCRSRAWAERKRELSVQRAGGAHAQGG